MTIEAVEWLRSSRLRRLSRGADPGEVAVVPEGIASGVVLTSARAPVRLSATVNYACRHNSGNNATTRPARCAAKTVSTSSTVLGNCTAITELDGNPDSMKWADSAVIARSASAKVRRLGGWPVMLALLSGSSSANASGVRARIRRNNPSSVGVALGWITGIT